MKKTKFSEVLDQWAHGDKVKLQFSRLGKPTDNAMIETFNAKVRLECLNQQWFESLADARQILEGWRQEYNQERPHSSLEDKTPSEFVAQWQQLQRLQRSAG
jgi:putative transposase